jgi:enoyl-CoA hydratase/carnithine racemase
MAQRGALVETRKDGGVAVVRMVNERSRNSLSNEMRVELRSLCRSSA